MMISHHSYYQHLLLFIILILFTIKRTFSVLREKFNRRNHENKKTDIDLENCQEQQKHISNQANTTLETKDVSHSSYEKTKEKNMFEI